MRKIDYNMSNGLQKADLKINGGTLGSDKNHDDIFLFPQD